MGASNLLTMFTCLEWIVLFEGGRSLMFLLQNHMCYLDLEFGPKNTTDHVLTIKSESKIPLSFAVKVQVVAGKSTTTGPTKTFQGTAPFEIWRGDFGKYVMNKRKFRVLTFRVMFAESSNIELIENANAKTDEKHTSSLEKMICLEWITKGDPRNMKSPWFLIDDRKFYFNFRKRGSWTLALDSDTNERLRTDDVEFQVGKISGEVTRDRKCIEKNPPYTLWESHFPDDLRDVLYFRVFFDNCLNIKLIEDADAKTGKNSEISLRCLSSDIGKMLGSNASDSKSDVTVQCGDTTFSAHQIILATRSDVLKAILKTIEVETISARQNLPELQRNKAESDPIVLQIEGMQPPVCRIFLEYLYTATLPDLSVEDARVLNAAAVKYGVVSLEKQCSDVLVKKYPDLVDQ